MHSKHTQVLEGGRAILRNVFVRNYADIRIPSMVDWYSELSRAGVAITYVSNSPFELVRVIRAFFQDAQLPVGTLRLKQYDRGGGLFSNLWQPAGLRKRPNVEAVLKVCARVFFRPFRELLNISEGVE